MKYTLQKDYYSQKPINYYNSAREDLYNIIFDSGKFKNVLEIGCGRGDLSLKLKENGIAISITGIEPFYKDDVQINKFKNFYFDSIENVINSNYLNGEQFDLLVLGDVLEHLVDPWLILKNLVNDYLKPGAVVIVSVPNFRNLQTLATVIFKNTFKYAESGVLDKTHLRFFCKKDLTHLIINSGLGLEKITPNFQHKKLVYFKKNRLRLLNQLTLNLIPFWLTDQMIAVARKK